MGKLKSLASVLALGFAFLFLGPATATARADQFRHGFGHGSFHGRAFAHRSFPFRHHGFVRPFHSFRPRVGFGFGFARPYRLVRVFVYDPFPRWVYRRVYDSQPYYPYPYAGADCPY